MRKLLSRTPLLTLTALVVISTNLAHIAANLLVLNAQTPLDVFIFDKAPQVAAYAMMTFYAAAAILLCVSLISAAITGLRGGMFIPRRRSIALGLLIAASAVLIEVTTDAQGLITTVSLPIQLGLAWFFISAAPKISAERPAGNAA